MVVYLSNNNLVAVTKLLSPNIRRKLPQVWDSRLLIGGSPLDPIGSKADFVQFIVSPENRPNTDKVDITFLKEASVSPNSRSISSA